MELLIGSTSGWLVSACPTSGCTSSGLVDQTLGSTLPVGDAFALHLAARGKLFAEIAVN